MFIHGRTYTAEYEVWKNMKKRCLDSKSKDFQNYGARGITVCERWLNSFENFYDDMGDRPSDNYTLERIDVNGNYTPDNCKWATRLEQARNQRKRRDNNTGYQGVSWEESRGKWCARIKVDGKDIRIGRFANIEDAVQARKQAEIRYWKSS